MPAKKANKKEETFHAETLRWAVGIVVTISIAVVGYYEWQKDRKPSIRYVDYKQEGVLGRTAVNFSSHYKNVGKTDATEVTMDSRFFTAEHYDPSLSVAESMAHSIGTTGPGLDIYNTGYMVPLLQSTEMTSPMIDKIRVWWHERISYKDEDGNLQPILDTCMVWEREHQQFVKCSKEN